MMNVRLCDALQPCSPSWSDELCRRCVREQYENILEQIDDCECLDYEYDESYDDEDYYPTDFY